MPYERRSPSSFIDFFSSSEYFRSAVFAFDNGTEKWKWNVFIPETPIVNLLLHRTIFWDRSERSLLATLATRSTRDSAMSGARSGAVSMMVRKSKDKRQQESLLAAFKVERE